MSSLIGGLLALLTSFFKAGSGLVNKYNLNDNMNEYIAGWGYRAFALPILSLLVFITGVPELHREFWISLCISIPISVVATIFFMRALKISDISLVSPLSGLTPALVLVTSPIMLGEFASPLGIIGVLFVTMGVYFLNIQEAATGYLAPIKALFDDRGAQYAMAVAGMYSISANIDKIGVESSSPIFWTFSVHVGVSIIFLFIIEYKFDNGVRRATKQWKSLLPMGTLSGLGTAAQMFAITYTLVVYVNAIKRATLIWEILGGKIIFNEDGFKQRIIGGSIVIIGIILISLAL